LICHGKPKHNEKQKIKNSAVSRGNDRLARN
jgi:hypothetical protein